MTNVDVQSIITELEKKLTTVYTPSSPITKEDNLKGRGDLLDTINRAVNRIGSSIIMYGMRGVGKSSICRVLESSMDKAYYYSVDNDDTFETVMSFFLKKFDRNWTQSSSKDESETKLTGGGNYLSATQKSKSVTSNEKYLPSGITSQEIVDRFPNDKIILIVDEFERISDELIKKRFAELIKKISDNSKKISIVICGIAENVNELFQSHESILRSIQEIIVKPLSDIYIKEVIENGESKLGISTNEDIKKQIMRNSLNFPYFTHLICEGMVYGLIENMKRFCFTVKELGQKEYDYSVKYAINNASSQIINLYEKITLNSRGSKRMNYALYALAISKNEIVTTREISERIAKFEKKDKVNPSHQISKLLEFEVLKTIRQGHFKMINPMLKAYIILHSTIDSDVEFKLVDQLLDEAKMRIDRVGNIY